jgi:hypothetical protein
MAAVKAYEFAIEQELQLAGPIAAAEFQRQGGAWV